MLLLATCTESVSKLCRLFQAVDLLTTFNKLGKNIRLVVLQGNLTTLIQARCKKIVTKLTTQGCNNIFVL